MTTTVFPCILSKFVVGVAEGDALEIRSSVTALAMYWTRGLANGACLKTNELLILR